MKPPLVERFKIVRLKAIHNGLKRTISASDDLKLLPLILELDTERCVSEDTELLRKVDCEIPR